MRLGSKRGPIVTDPNRDILLHNSLIRTNENLGTFVYFIALN